MTRRQLISLLGGAAVMRAFLWPKAAQAQQAKTYTIGVKSPALWGTGARITELFGARASSIQLEQREFAFRYRSAQHWLDVFKTYYGPLLKTFGALDPKGQTALTEDLFALIKSFNRSGDATMVVPSEYLEVVVTRRA